MVLVKVYATQTILTNSKFLGNVNPGYSDPGAPVVYCLKGHLLSIVRHAGNNQ